MQPVAALSAHWPPAVRARPAVEVVAWRVKLALAGIAAAVGAHSAAANLAVIALDRAARAPLANSWLASSPFEDVPRLDLAALGSRLIHFQLGRSDAAVHARCIGD